ncbi:hypothetical protein [Ralstonia sp. ASV6]|uniref:hypothetical protein n=1 Tax=Ralstonia sp. ASV6 TaxID=2795124 RepID=UPI0018EA9F53|nr:hypothetical protein [Ralstonia sp. ASV6]
MSTSHHFCLHPSSFAADGILPDNVDGIVESILAQSPAQVTIMGFDQSTAAAIANRLVAQECTLRVHVSGSGEVEWPHAEDIYASLMFKLRMASKEPMREGK